MANLKRLKTATAADKGEPPAAASPANNLAEAPREANEPKARLEFNVPQSLFDEFSEEAVLRYGHKKGSKLKLFLDMCEALRKSG